MLGVGACLVGVTLFVKAEIPAELAEKLQVLTDKVEALVAQEIPTKAEREKLAQPLELEVSFAVIKLNEYVVGKKISMQDAMTLSKEFTALWGALTEWKNDVEEETS